MDRPAEEESRTYTAPELAELAGMSYRRLDYYTRSGLLSPVVRGASGSGSRREYDERDLARARLIGALRDLGAEVAIVARVLEALPFDPEEWPPYFFVTPAGVVKRGLPLPAACWWISTGVLLTRELTYAA